VTNITWGCCHHHYFNPTSSETKWNYKFMFVGCFFLEIAQISNYVLLYYKQVQRTSAHLHGIDKTWLVPLNDCGHGGTRWQRWYDNSRACLLFSFIVFIRAIFLSSVFQKIRLSLYSWKILLVYCDTFPLYRYIGRWNMYCIAIYWNLLFHYDAYIEDKTDRDASMNRYTSSINIYG
jgi:hypothetical protein